MYLGQDVPDIMNVRMKAEQCLVMAACKSVRDPPVQTGRIVSEWDVGEIPGEREGEHSFGNTV